VIIADIDAAIDVRILLCVASDDRATTSLGHVRRAHVRALHWTNPTASFLDQSTASFLDQSTASFLDQSTASFPGSSTASFLDQSTAYSWINRPPPSWTSRRRRSWIPAPPGHDTRQWSPESWLRSRPCVDHAGSARLMIAEPATRFRLPRRFDMRCATVPYHQLEFRAVGSIQAVEAAIRLCGSPQRDHRRRLPETATGAALSIRPCCLVSSGRGQPIRRLKPHSQLRRIRFCYSSRIQYRNRIPRRVRRCLGYIFSTAFVSAEAASHSLAHNQRNCRRDCGHFGQY